MVNNLNIVLQQNFNLHIFLRYIFNISLQHPYKLLDKYYMNNHQNKFYIHLSRQYRMIQDPLEELCIFHQCIINSQEYSKINFNNCCKLFFYFLLKFLINFFFKFTLSCTKHTVQPVLSIHYSQSVKHNQQTELVSKYIPITQFRQSGRIFI